MGNAAAELADRFQFLGRGKLILGLLELALVFNSLGDITRYLGEADEVSRIVIDWIYDHRSPECVPSLRTRRPSASKRPVLAARCNAFCGTPALRSSSV